MISSCMTTEGCAALHDLLVQGMFLLTGVFSTCVAQFIFYQGAGDQKAMLLPLCNYMGMMLVGLLPVMSTTTRKIKVVEEQVQQKEKKKELPTKEIQRSPEDDVEPELTPILPTTTAPSRRLSADYDVVDMELVRRSAVLFEDNQQKEPQVLLSENDGDDSDEKKLTLGCQVTPSFVSFSLSALQLCVIVSVVLDFSGCIFSNVGLSMAGSGLYQVLYSSVICWSALMSRLILKKVVSKEEWFGIALVTFGLAFSALGESKSGRDNTLVLMGCVNTLVGAAFYGGNYVTGEYTLRLAERPNPNELCLQIGAACVAIIVIYQSVFVLPEWDTLVMKPIAEAHGNTTYIISGLVAYTVSQLAHGLTYFVILGSSGAVTTGIMQSLRAVCVFVISSMLYCSQQESQCFDTKRGVATMIVVSGVMFYSWAKSQQGKKSMLAPLSSWRPLKDSKIMMIASKNYVV